jgi:hypothetical protein
MHGLTIDLKKMRGSTLFIDSKGGNYKSAEPHRKSSLEKVLVLKKCL